MGTTSGQSLDLTTHTTTSSSMTRLQHFLGPLGVESGAICFRSQGAQGREAARFLAPGGLLVHSVTPPLPFTWSCISNCILLALRR